VTQRRLKAVRGQFHALEEGVFIPTILCDALQALRYLHDKQLAHRDVKASKILINANGDVRLFAGRPDFWTSKRGKRHHDCITIRPDWIAPEVFEMTEEFGCQADVWSLGITAIELGTGETPYAHLEPLKAMVRILDHPPPTLLISNDRCVALT
jgi:serine/threonine protein kinase